MSDAKAASARSVFLLLQGCKEHEAEHTMICGVYSSCQKAEDGRTDPAPAGYWIEEWLVDV